MKWFCAIIFLIFTVSFSTVYAQGDDLQLAQQFTINGESLKALDIYQKLFKADNEAYYSFYIKCLLTLKKFDDAESISKKMMRKHPGDEQYIISLGQVYIQRGSIDKANALYDELLKKNCLPTKIPLPIWPCSFTKALILTML